jgi:RimJ/RimL family protein N-acetyltransferase
MAIVTLRPWAETDLPVLEEANTPAMTRFLGGPESDDEVRARHARYLRLNASGEAWMSAIEVDGVAAGGIGFWPMEHDDQPGYEAGWHVLPRFAGRGVAREALGLLLTQVAAAPPRGLLYAYPSVENAASNALCRSAGFTARGEIEAPWRGGMLRMRVWALDPAPPLPRTGSPS